MVLLASAPPDAFGRQLASSEYPSQHPHADGTGSMPLFAARDASGTSWQPDTSPMHGVQRRWRGWTLMLHANVFAQLLYEPGDRHRTGGAQNWQVSSVNWGMATARRPAGRGRVGLRAMLSVEPWTVGDCGYLNLLATGEVCEGDTIHDRQHPHDLFMELAAEYDRPLRGSLRWHAYAGFAGEPALGPVGFPHRLSALNNPIAPIAHHWLDSTHVAFGVITTGLAHRRWKAEASLFNAREPDAHRADLDLGRLDSLSARLSLIPSDPWALQISAAHLREAEAIPGLDTRVDVRRLTASATYHRTSVARTWATTVAYGMNDEREAISGAFFDATTHALLIESSLWLRQGHSWFGRAEVAGKPAHDLHAHEFRAKVFTVGKVQAGYERSFQSWKGLTPGFGGTLSLNVVPPDLSPRYSGRVAPGAGVFFSLRSARHAELGRAGHALSGA